MKRVMENSEGLRSAGSMHMAVIYTGWNEYIVGKLLEGCLRGLEQSGIKGSSVTRIKVPGAFEIPLAAKKAAATGRYDAVIALGCVIRGDTYHFEIVADNSARGIMDAALQTGVPVINGILTTNNLQQAEERAGADTLNKGYEAALAAIETVNVLGQIAGGE